MAAWRPGDPPTTGGDLPSPVLPGLPGVADYGSLDATITGLGFRHAAQLLDPRWVPGAKGASPAGEGFLVLDGLWFPPERGFLWQRVDQAFVAGIRARWAASGDVRARPVAEALETLEGVQRDDPMGLRRLVLWQLGCLLKDGDEGAVEAAARRLGVHGSEAGPLAAAVAATFPAAGPARHAAETITEVVAARRLREAARLAADLPAASPDHVLNGLVTGLRSAAAKADGLMAEAARRQRSGDLRAAGQAWLRAHRLMPDDQRAYAGLLGAAVLAADAPQRPGDVKVDATIAADTVRLDWRPPSSSEITFKVLRFPERDPLEAVEVRGPDAAPSATDNDAPAGVPLRYCVIPLRGDRIGGVPRATSPVMLPPEVARPRAVQVPDGARLSWLPHPEATDIRVMRWAEDGGSSPVLVPCDRDGLTDPSLEPGQYRYTITCGYTGLDGRPVRSPGRQVTIKVAQWPTPVEELTVRRVGDGGRVALAWPRPATGQVCLVRWPFGASPPGEDVSELFNRLPGEARQAHQLVGTPGTPGSPNPSGTEALAELTAPPRTTVRLAAVSVLGDLAVSGPSVVIENPGAVEGLRVRRLAPDRAEVRFTWPEPAVLVLLRWQRGDVPMEARIPRSRFLARGALVILVSREQSEITVTTVPRPDAVHIAAAVATAILPAVPTPVLPPLRRPWPGARPDATIPDAATGAPDAAWAAGPEAVIWTAPPVGPSHDQGRRWRRWLRRLNPFARRRKP
ncbi:hypothetical protein [Actinomadura sp. 3N508]|uniref:hypothetical protein n=1 Tax=Actinomadura sp. 3N508 TaxID=3375153 RepID=UPI00379C1B4B